MVKLSDKISGRDFYKGLRDFGFGNLTSIDLLGETKGKLKTPNSYSGISKAFISHGYEISVTPIQMLMAYSALINGGNLIQPYILKRILDNSGELIDEFNTVKIRNVINKRTSDRIREIMVGVVENGTGSLAQQENVYVGGKTGTSQKLINGKYSRKFYNSSFIGFFPANDPQVICLVLVDSPEVGRYGGQVAAPIFGNITRKILETDFSIERNKNKIERNTIIRNLVANIEETNFNEDEITFSNFSDEDQSVSTDRIKRSTMPSLKNKAIREAIKILSDLNIKYIINGSGRVKKQSIKVGDPISNGMTCILNCSPSTKGLPK